MRPQSTQGEIERLESEMQTIKLRREGYTIAEIAERLGTCEKTVFNRLKSAMDRVRAEIKIDAQMHREMELDKLERLESKLYRAADATLDNEEVCKLSAQIVRISESRRKLLGIDAPQRVEHSGPLFTVSEASPLTKAWPDATNEATLHEDQVQVEGGRAEEP
jgi:transposase